MMEVGPWRWDGKSEQDFWVKPGGWDDYTTVVYGQFSTLEESSMLSHVRTKWTSLQALVSLTRARIVMCILSILWVLLLLRDA